MAEQTTLDKHLHGVLSIKEKPFPVPSSNAKAPEPSVQSSSIPVSSLNSLVGHASSTAEKPGEATSLDQLGLDVKQYKEGGAPDALHLGGKSTSYEAIALEKMRRGEGVVSDTYTTKPGSSSDPSSMYSIAGDIDDLMDGYSSGTHSVGDRYHDSMDNVGIRYDADPCCDRDSTYLH